MHVTLHSHNDSIPGRSLEIDFSSQRNGAVQVLELTARRTDTGTMEGQFTLFADPEQLAELRDAINRHLLAERPHLAIV